MLLTVTNLSSTAAVVVPFPFDISIAASSSATRGVSEADFLRHNDDKGNPAWKVWDDLIKRGSISVAAAAPSGDSILETLSRPILMAVGPFTAAGIAGVIAATQTNLDMRYSHIAAAAPTSYVATRAGFITGLSGQLEAAVGTADEVQLRVTINGTEVTALTACQFTFALANTEASAVFPRGLHPVAVGDVVGISYTSGAGVSNTPTLVATLELEV